MRRGMDRRLAAIGVLGVVLTWAVGGDASAWTLLDVTAGVIDANHPQVATSGGSSAHLLRVVTPLDRIHTAIDADVLLADGSPLTMRWRRDAGDADLLELAFGLVVDSGPCHVDMRIAGDSGQPEFAATGDVSTSALTQVVAPARVLLQFPAAIDPLTDVLIGDVDLTIARSDVLPWILDATALGVGDTFDLVLRAGPPGDTDDDDDVDAGDHAALVGCLEASDLTDDCGALFDFNADSVIDLRDFAEFQRLFTGAGMPAACGG